MPPVTTSWNVLPLQLALSIDLGLTSRTCGTGVQLTVVVTDFCGELESRKLNVVVPLPVASPEIRVEPPDAAIDAGLMLVLAALDATA